MNTPTISSFSVLVGNTLWNLNGAFQFDFNVLPGTVEEVLQNLYNIWAVPIHSQPWQRAFGNDLSWIDTPGNVEQMQMSVAFLIACAKWEPRAKFNKIQFTITSAANAMSGVYDLSCELTIDLTKQIQNAIFSAPGPVNYWVIQNKQDGTTPFVTQANLTL